ncbi:hypothetical protein DFQ04_0856 [Algoriphagus boseongensis]|uniref:Uncharacterized protein n=1 Tax=Algoriphagus boseongensis TaxID=1442587 RepID=A0A4R6T9W3_9BACT|nr:hypothetical protein [Algoriphagus boseongensis]TDQ19039.1 hypothetical protein DFQ04_0856 [Algoriphagus boseongensis]
MKYPILFFIFIWSTALKAQSVIVNPDGTHSVIHDHGNTQVIVNPNGTHSILLGTGNIKTLVNPDGTHSQLIDHGATKILVNPNGNHSILTGIISGPTPTTILSVVSQASFRNKENSNSKSLPSQRANPQWLKIGKNRYLLLPDGRLIPLSKKEKKPGR